MRDGFLDHGECGCAVQRIADIVKPLVRRHAQFALRYFAHLISRRARIPGVDQYDTLKIGIVTGVRSACEASHAVAAKHYSSRIDAELRCDISPVNELNRGINILAAITIFI